MEDLDRDRNAFFSLLCEFLGVPPVDAQRPHLNKSTGKAVPTSAYTRVNRVPGIHLAKAVLPSTLKTAVKEKLLSRRVEVRPQFSRRTRDQLIELLEPDGRRLLEHCGKSQQFWTY
jgi:hypothetical protein